MSDADDLLDASADELQKAERVLKQARRAKRKRRDGGLPTFTCPVCGGQSNQVKNSRGKVSREAVRRRRECLSCQARWSTEEQIDPSSIKKSA